MRAIVLMFDTLNRHHLSCYEPGTWVRTPAFDRLARRTAVFENSYVCSMPCMPARRDLQTARPNFLHRSWGPLEPFDDSMPEMLKRAGIYTHLATDHYHYFEEGGANYHTKYNTWEFFFGQEGDPWWGQVARPSIPECVSPKTGPMWEQDWLNRAQMRTEADFPQTRTVRAGLDFIRRNRREDNWLLHLETFDPHEPFFSAEKYRQLYATHYERYRGRHFDWPPYARVTETPAEVEHLRHEYAALVAMCDARLGEVLDTMDELDLWKDTMLVVCTDHGFLLGEHDCWAKVWQPYYQEIAHTPFFIWDPRTPGAAGRRRRALVQPAIDLPVTLLEFFGQSPTPRMLGRSLAPVVRDDSPVRTAAIFGQHGAHVNITDGRHVYMRGPVTPANQPLFNHTLMPAHMRGAFGGHELRAAGLRLGGTFRFSQGMPLLQVPAEAWGRHTNEIELSTRLYDVSIDPRQENPLDDPGLEARWSEAMTALMRECDAPPEQYVRLGLA